MIFGTNKAAGYCVLNTSLHDNSYLFRLRNHKTDCTRTLDAVAALRLLIDSDGDTAHAGPLTHHLWLS